MEVEVKLCYGLVWNSEPLRRCTNPAKYRYDAGRGRIEYLCGVHAQVYKGSENLTPLPKEGGSRDPSHRKRIGRCSIHA